MEFTTEFTTEFKNTHFTEDVITTGTSTLDQHLYWSNSKMVRITEYSESIEFIYKQKSLTTLGVYPPRPSAERVFKIVYSCKDGKWHRSEPIYGTIVPETKETYVFDEN